MKSKLIIASLLLAGACGVNAQEKPKYYTDKPKDNIFIGVGLGGMSVLNGGLNTPTLNFNISVGKYFTPVWGVRGQFSGISQSLDRQSNDYHRYCKGFGEINLDAMLNLINLFGGYNPNRAFNLYLFGGPTMNLSKAVNTNLSITTDGKQSSTYTEKGIRTRFGATVGLDLSYDINPKWAVNLGGRVGVSPSVFGDASDCRKSEATARVNIGVAYTFGGKKFVASSNVDGAALNAEIKKYKSDLAKTQAELASCKSALANMKPEKEVIKEVAKEVEVVKEVEVTGPRAIFFNIGQASIDDYGLVNIKLAAEILKANPDKKYKITGYADKATGSAAWNQKLSEKRAKNVYDALIKQGVNKDQLELVGFGGTENMFGKDSLNRVIIIE